jgi:Fe-S-cluster-containing dehydrogenase component
MSDIINIRGKRTPVQWRSVEDYEGQKAALEAPDSDSPNAQLAAEQDLTRRGFMGWTGATVAGASALLSGCIRKAEEQILPYTRRPEDYIPGQPAYFATSASIGGGVVGLLVESQDGRPTKIDGNPRHPGSGKGSTAFAQAEVMELYDSERTRTPLKDGHEATWADWDTFAGSHFKGGGRGVALLLDDTDSPTVQRLLGAFRRKNPQAKVYQHGPGRRSNTLAGLDSVGLTGLQPVYDLGRAKVILSLDSDFLGVDGDTVANSAGFAKGRQVADVSASMSRLYAVEAAFSITGMAADNRLRLASSQVRNFLIALGKKVFGSGVAAPAGAEAVVSALRPTALDPTTDKWVGVVAADLVANKGSGALVVGERQPASVHALAALLNTALGNVGSTVAFAARDDLKLDGGIAELTASLTGGSVSTLVVLDGNPVSRAPGALGFAAALGKAATVVHVGLRNDATAKKSGWHLPVSHFLESWGDHRSTEGTAALQQPLIEPLYGTRSVAEILGGLTGEGSKGLDLVRATWSDSSDADWRKALHEGVVSGSTGSLITPLLAADPAPVVDPDAATPAPPAPSAHAWNWSDTGAIVGKAHVPAGSSPIEVNWRLDYTLFDGRYANNPWLQELPDPMTKLAWDNIAQLSPKTASGLSVKHGDFVNLEIEGRSLDLPVTVTPGVADNTVILSLGYGEAGLGQYADEGLGFDTNSLRDAAFPAFRVGVGLSKAKGRDYELATTQNHHRMEPGFGYPARPLVRENTLAEFKEEPGFVDGFELLPEDKLKSLWVQPNVTTGHQWGKSIDLNLCTGCNSCTIACQAENNISVVGKERVAYGREMHWIRIDRYFTGDPEDPEAVVQPIACAHCETAPCEGVCPVAATSHGPEGLNDIAYNRCVGTRYCANNCPYKVRRYNFFAYAKDEDTANPNVVLQRNPDVTVRFRGVIEKCSYCVQRINAAKIDAKRSGDGKVPDGAIVPACAQACPTEAIVFGDQNDPTTMVSKAKANPRNYALLAELNIHPRTTFLARIRNPNPELA